MQNARNTKIIYSLTFFSRSLIVFRSSSIQWERFCLPCCQFSKTIFPHHIQTGCRISTSKHYCLARTNIVVIFLIKKYLVKIPIGKQIENIEISERKQSSFLEIIVCYNFLRRIRLEWETKLKIL